MNRPCHMYVWVILRTSSPSPELDEVSHVSDTSQMCQSFVREMTVSDTCEKWLSLTHMFQRSDHLWHMCQRNDCHVTYTCVSERVMSHMCQRQSFLWQMTDTEKWLRNDCRGRDESWLPWHDSFTCVTWLIHMCDMTHSHVWHDSFICVQWLSR